MELKAVVSEKVQTLRGYIAHNKGLTVLLSVLILLFSAGLIFLSIPDDAPATSDPLPAITTDFNGLPEEADPDSEQVEILPQLERMEREGALQPLDPFAAPPMLMGVLLGGGGEDIAIIEAGGNTYITRIGDRVAGLWQVREIHKDKAIIRMGEHETILHLGR